MNRPLRCGVDLSIRGADINGDPRLYTPCSGERDLTEADICAAGIACTVKFWRVYITYSVPQLSTSRINSELT